MKITNRNNLPQAIIDAYLAIQKDYDKGDADFSATELIKPPFMRQLEIAKRDVMEVDIINLLNRLGGTAIHMALERAKEIDEERNYVTERRLFGNVNGTRISGQADVYYNKELIIQDYKYTSVWSVVNGPKEEWIQQLNILDYLAKKNDINANKLQVFAWMKDWSPSRAKRERDYPQEKACVIDIPIWPGDATHAFILARIGLHKDPNPPVCSQGDRWQRQNKWAVMKRGQKRAVKLHTSEENAKSHIFELASREDGKFCIEPRPGARVRCEDYCDVSCFCEDYLKTQKEDF